MNKWIGMGRLTKDPDVKHNDNKAIARFTIAVDRKYKTEEQSADFIGCIAFGKTAEFIEKYGRKGTKFVVDGRIATGFYFNKDNEKVYTTDVIIENVEFAESKSSGTDSPITNNNGFINIPDGIEEELPFK